MFKNFLINQLYSLGEYSSYLLHAHSLMSTLAFLPRSMQGLISSAVLPSASRQALCRACDSPRRHCDEQLLQADHGAQLGPL